MPGNIGSLGSVSYDIIANDETGRGLDSARQNFVVTAGDILNSIESIAAKLAEFDEKNAKLNTNLGITALTLGMNAEELRGMARELSNATDPIDEMSGLIDVLARAGLRSRDDIMSTAEAWDKFADAVGEDSDTFTNTMVPAFQAFGIPIQDVGKYSNELAYTFNATGVTADQFATAINRAGPEIAATGATMDDLSAIMLILKERGYNSRNMMSELTTSIGNQADANMDGKVSFDEMLASMKITNDELSTTKSKISDSSKEYAGLAAGIRNDNIPMQEKYNNTMDNTILGAGNLTTPLTGAASLFTNLASTISGLAIPAMVLFPGKFAAVSASISSTLSGLSGSVSAAASGIGGSIAIGITGGIVAGLAGVWTLDKLGILKGLSDLGRQIESSPIGSTIMNSLKVVLAPLGSLGAGIIDIVRGDFDKIGPDMVKPFQQAGDAAKENIDRIKEAFSGIGSTAAGGVDALGGAVQRMIGSFAGMGSIAGYAGSAFAGIGGAFSGMAGQVQGVFSSMFSSIQGLIGSTAGGFYNAGANIITSMVNGIVAAAGGIVTAIGNALNRVRALFPFSPAKEGPLADTPNWGSWMSQGMEKAAPEVASSASMNLAAPVAAAAGGVGGMVGGGGDVGVGAGGGGGSIVNIAAGAIVINGAGQNAEEIANQVITKLAQQMASTRKSRGLIA